MQALLEYWAGTGAFVSYVTQTSIAHLPREKFVGMPLPVPPPQEQARIASALSDADALIANLERIVEKKRAIKLGMTQELLSGRTRLPGFARTWETVRLLDVGSTYGGLTGKSKDDFRTGTATFVTFMEVMAGIRLRGTRLERVHVGPEERQNHVLRGDVLFNGSSETPDEVALAAVVDYDPSPRTYLNSFCFGYRLKRHDRIDPTFLAHFFRARQGRDLIAALAQGATRYNIAKTKLMATELVLPPVDEQQAVVKALSSAEDELDILVARLAKARAVKQGMMQQLLSGRVCLPAKDAA
jgi:type I restriction enzyme S subunit